MKTVGLKEIKACFELGLRHHNKEIKFNDALDLAVEQLGMERATASGYISNVRSLIEGKEYKRTISADAVRYYLVRIHDTLGYAVLLSAIVSVEAHRTYFEALKGKKAEGAVRNVVAEIKARFVKDVTYSDQQVGFQKDVKASLASAERDRLARLAKASVVPATRVVQLTAYQRNPDVVAQALVNAGGVCQRCRKPAPFKRKDGTSFLEVLHVIPLAEGGHDTVENARAICPNCHREAHFGAELVLFV